MMAPFFVCGNHRKEKMCCKVFENVLKLKRKRTLPAGQQHAALEEWS